MKTVRLQVTEKLEIESVVEFEVSKYVEDEELIKAIDFLCLKANRINEIPHYLREYGLVFKNGSSKLLDCQNPSTIEIDQLTIEEYKL